MALSLYFTLSLRWHSLPVNPVLFNSLICLVLNKIIWFLNVFSKVLFSVSSMCAYIVVGSNKIGIQRSSLPSIKLTRSPSIIGPKLVILFVKSYFSRHKIVTRLRSSSITLLLSSYFAQKTL